MSPRPGEFEAWLAFRTATGATPDQSALAITYAAELAAAQRQLAKVSRQLAKTEKPAARARPPARKKPPASLTLAERHAIAVRKREEKRAARLAANRYRTAAAFYPVNGPVCAAWMPGALCGVCNHDSCWAATAQRKGAA